MEVEEEETPRVGLTHATFVVLAATLACMAAVPAAFWLADQALLPWADELRWSRLRAAPLSDAVGIAANDFVQLHRTGCFGWCPVYRVTLYASGRVEYSGRQYVCEVGPRTSIANARVAARLVSDLRDAGFFEMNWTATDDVTDSSLALMKLSIGGRVRVVRDYHGDLSAPRLLRRFEDTIDEVAGTAQWLPVRDAQGKVCANGRSVRD